MSSALARPVLAELIASSRKIIDYAGMKQGSSADLLFKMDHVNTVLGNQGVSAAMWSVLTQGDHPKVQLGDVLATKSQSVDCRRFMPTNLYDLTLLTGSPTVRTPRPWQSFI